LKKLKQNVFRGGNAMSLEFIESLKKQWMAMIDAIEDPLAIVDENYTIVRQNKSYVEVSSQPEIGVENFKGKKCYEIFAGRDSPCESCLLKNAIEKNEKQMWESSTLFEDKEFDVQILPLKDKDVKEALFVLHYRDITHQKSMQAQLSHTEKLAALGKLAGGIGHEINSPLSGILAFAQMALKEMDENNPHLQDMQEIEVAAQKCKKIVEGVLGYARQDHTQVEIVKVLEILDGPLRLSKHSLQKYNIKLNKDLPEGSQQDDFTVYANSGKLEQVFMNLITNAIYAMKDSGGVLNISAHRDQNNVIVTLSDTGPGVPSNVAKKIFDPFFTTKPVGEGTGLGLSISYSIIRSFEGELSLEQNPGEGATFKVTLPAHVKDNEV